MMRSAEIAQLMREHGIMSVKVGGADLEGIYRGRRVTAPQFLEALDHTFSQSDRIFSWDIAEQPISGLLFTGWQTGFPNIEMKPDLETFAVVPWEEHTASVVCDFVTHDEKPVPVSPRYVLRRVLEKAGQMGFSPVVGIELQVRFYRESAISIREKRFHNLTPLSPSPSAYSIYRASMDEFLISKIRRAMEGYGITIEGYAREREGGMYEFSLRHAIASSAADKAMLFKTGVKEICAQEGLLASFMAKPFEKEDGLSGHLHLSVWDGEGRNNLFFDADKGGMSEVMRYFLGGLIATMREFAVMFAPNVNSYKRFVSDSWAPINISWGEENRTVALRVASPTSTRAIRIEHRVPGADLNPYLAIAAAIAGGLHGIQNKIEPPEPVKGNAYQLPPEKVPPLPKSLREAAFYFQESQLAREWFGEEFVTHYALTRRHEAEQYYRIVSDWERERYFEAV